jgi:hypothetical protein
MLWQLAKWGYIAFQVNMANTQLAIYGIFAQLPVLMLWFYISWMVTLLGAEVTFAYQNVSTYPLERFAASPSVYMREWLASSLYLSLVQAFMAGTGPWSALAFAQQHRIPLRLMRELVAILVSTKLLVEAADAPEHYVPGRDPSTLTPWDILYALRHHGHLDVGTIESQHALATALISQVEAAGGRRFQLGECWHSMKNTLRFWNHSLTFQKEIDSRCYASTTAYVMMIRVCNRRSVHWTKPSRSRNCSLPRGRSPAL